MPLSLVILYVLTIVVKQAYNFGIFPTLKNFNLASIGVNYNYVSILRTDSAGSLPSYPQIRQVLVQPAMTSVKIKPYFEHLESYSHMGTLNCSIPGICHTHAPPFAVT